MFSKTWPGSGSLRNGTCSPPKTSARRIVGSGGGAWLPTPIASGFWQTKNNRRATGRQTPTLEGMARTGRWPTPSSAMVAGYRGEEKRKKVRAGHQGNELLRRVHAEMVPTPTAGDSMRSGSRAKYSRATHEGVTLTDYVGRGQLNPGWVEWLMAFPIGHTDCARLATPSSLPRPAPPSVSCGTG